MPTLNVLYVELKSRKHQRAYFYFTDKFVVKLLKIKILLVKYIDIKLRHVNGWGTLREEGGTLIGMREGIFYLETAQG